MLIYYFLIKPKSGRYEICIFRKCLSMFNKRFFTGDRQTEYLLILCESRVMARSIAVSITLGAVGKLVINLAKVYAIIKKANRSLWTLTKI